MKRLLHFLLFLLLAHSASAQFNPYAFAFNDTLDDGEYTKSFNAKKISTYFVIEKGKLKHYKEFFRNGDIRVEYTFENGKLEGVGQIWKKRFRLKEERTFRQDTLLIANYFNYRLFSSKVKTNYTHYIFPQLRYGTMTHLRYVAFKKNRVKWGVHGIIDASYSKAESKIYRRNDNLKRIYHADKNVYDGIWASYYRNGAVKKEITYDDHMQVRIVTYAKDGTEKSVQDLYEIYPQLKP